MVSRYYHLTLNQGLFSGTLDELVADPGWGALHLYQYLESWQPHLNENHIAVYSYKELLGKPKQTLISITKHLNLPSTDDEIKAALAQSSFSRMRALEEKFGIGEPNNYDVKNPQARRVRKGRPGSGRELSPDSYNFLFSALKDFPGASDIAERYNLI